MEVELAEIAVKDALSQRSFSQPNDSFAHDNSHAELQFINGDLSCFSNMDDSFPMHPSMNHTSSTPCLLDELNQPPLELRPVKHQAFKKKASELKPGLEVTHAP